MSVNSRIVSVILSSSVGLRFVLIGVTIGRSDNPTHSSGWGEAIVITDVNAASLLRASRQFSILIATYTAYSTVHLQNCLNVWQNGDIKGAGFHSHGGENKRASNRWLKTDELACMHKNQGETNNPLRLLVLRELSICTDGGVGAGWAEEQINK